MPKVSLITLAMVFVVGSVFGQEVGTDAATALYRNEMMGGVLFHSQGWGLTYKRGWHITATKKRLLEAEYVGMKHPKEKKTINTYNENAKSYFYGKLNSVSILRLGAGYQREITSKDGLDGIELRWLTYGGASLCFAKPIYLEIIQQPDLINEPLRVVPMRYDPTQHFLNNIYGRAPFTKGLSELALHPGLYAKTGLAFEYGTLQEDVKVIEVGVALDAYMKDVAIMAFQPARNYFFTFYVSLLYGGKW
ncbi:MAG: hypothetical protein H6585_02405 [Flavobacteriales bacterium]|nr:hypothetical protein [Flavobacteriales bacterium]MCB9447180.1 hypothetical protein [Flavobacteriales bacterium]